MTQLFALGFQVALEGWFAGDGGGDALGDADAGVFEGGYFFGVVGDEADGGDVEGLEDFGGEGEASVVVLEAEFEVGFDGVAALVLELVGAELGHEADAAAFLLFIEEDAGALGGDHGEGEVELVVAVAAQRVEDVSGEALGVDADQGDAGVEVAHGEGNGAFDVFQGRVAGLGDALEAENAEMSPTGREIGVGDLSDVAVLHGMSIDSRGGGAILS
jgi:hypothetical protein